MKTSRGSGVRKREVGLPQIDPLTSRNAWQAMGWVANFCQMKVSRKEFNKGRWRRLSSRTTTTSTSSSRLSGLAFGVLSTCSEYSCQMLVRRLLKKSRNSLDASALTPSRQRSGKYRRLPVTRDLAPEESATSMNELSSSSGNDLRRGTVVCVSADA